MAARQWQTAFWSLCRTKPLASLSKATGSKFGGNDKQNASHLPMPGHRTRYSSADAWRSLAKSTLYRNAGFGAQLTTGPIKHEEHLHHLYSHYRRPHPLQASACVDTAGHQYSIGDVQQQGLDMRHASVDAVMGCCHPVHHGCCPPDWRLRVSACDCRADMPE